MASKFLDSTGLSHLWVLLKEKFADKRAPIEIIRGTQTASTYAWKGVTTASALTNGMVILYVLPYDGKPISATLNLTLANGTTTGAKPVYLYGTTRVTTHYSAGSRIFMTYDTSAGAAGGWFVQGDRDSNYYDRIRWGNTITARSAITSGTVIVGSSSGFAQVAAGVIFDISYPILYATAAISANATASTGYWRYPSVSLTKTYASISGAAGKVAYLQGTLSGNIFTIAAEPITTTPSTEGSYYIPLGVMYSTTQLFFAPSQMLYYDGTALCPGPSSSGGSSGGGVVTRDMAFEVKGYLDAEDALVGKAAYDSGSLYSIINQWMTANLNNSIGTEYYQDMYSSLPNAMKVVATNMYNNNVPSKLVNRVPVVASDNGTDGIAFDITSSIDHDTSGIQCYSLTDIRTINGSLHRVTLEMVLVKASSALSNVYLIMSARPLGSLDVYTNVSQEGQ